jgi:hypothetical protein
MDNLTATAVANPESCVVCYNSIAAADNYCISCGYPIKGTETEQKHFMSERYSKEIDLEEFGKAVNTAGKTLYWLAGMTTVWGFIMYFITSRDRTDETVGTILIINLILAAMYLGLGLWSRTRPVTALISGFVLYLIVQVLSCIGDPSYIAKGIIIKIIFIGYFIKGIKAAMEAERMKKQYHL